MKGQMSISAGWTATRKQSTNRLVLNSPSWTPETWSPWDKSNNEEGEIKEERIAKGLSRREVANGAQFTGQLSLAGELGRKRIPAGPPTGPRLLCIH